MAGVKAKLCLITSFLIIFLMGCTTTNNWQADNSSGKFFYNETIEINSNQKNNTVSNYSEIQNGTDNSTENKNHDTVKQEEISKLDSIKAKPDIGVEQNTEMLPERNFTIEELEKRIMEIDKMVYLFHVADNNNTYAKSRYEKGYIFYDSAKNDLHYWVIVKIEDEKKYLETYDQFYEYVNPDSWEDWRYYINESSWELLRPAVSREELKEILPDYNYLRDYTTQTTFVTHRYVEKPLQNRYTQIPEYDFSAMVVNTYGYWQGNWEGGRVIYKIPCAKDLIVYMHPQWGMDFGNVGHWNAKEEDINFEADLIQKRPLMINNSEKIMEFCGIKSKIKTSKNIMEVNKKEDLVFNWKLFFMTQFKYNLTINDVKFSRFGNNIHMTFLNISIKNTNTHKSELMSDYDKIYIQIAVNDSGKVSSYTNTLFVGNNFLKNVTLNRDWIKSNSNDWWQIPITLNSTIIIKPSLEYLEYPYELHPTTIKFETINAS